MNCSSHRHKVAACPLAFGEAGVKKRVRSVLKYKKPALWIVIAAVIASLLLAVGFLTDPINEDNIGVKSISAKSVSSNVVELNIKYSYPTGCYSVRLVPEDEGEYCGDGMTDYDGALGKFRIMIEFGDTEPSKEFMYKYPVGEVVELENSPIKIRLKRVHPQDHGFVIYLGSDSPIYVDNSDNGKLDTFGGTVKIPINIISSDLIYGFVPPASEADKISYSALHNEKREDLVP